MSQTQFPVMKFLDFVSKKGWADLKLDVEGGLVCQNIRKHKDIAPLIHILPLNGYKFELDKAFVSAFIHDGIPMPLSDVDRAGIIFDPTVGDLRAIIPDPTVTQILVRIPLEVVLSENQS